MSDVLTPLRHAYGVEPTGPPLGLGDPGHREHEVLRDLRTALDGLPQHAPSAAAVEAVLARAAEPAADGLSAESPVEAALVDQSLSALDRLPRSRPSASAIAAVEAFAAEASSSLGAVRHVYEDAPLAPGRAVEAAVLRQSRDAIERSITARPRLRPSTAAVDAVLARAAEASGLEAAPALDTSAVEAAVLSQSHHALDRLPRAQAPAATIDAVRLAAATASAAAAANADPRPARPAPDRTPDRSRRRVPVGVWSGAAALLVAAIAAIVIFPSGAPADLAAVDAEPAPVAALAAPAPEPAAPEADEEAEASFETAPAGGSLMASSAVAAFVPVTQTRPQASAPSPSAGVALAAAAPSGGAAPPPAWEASDDVRTLSLRLQELDAKEGLEWDEPAEAFGAPAARARTATPGLRVVREGAPPAAVAPPPPAQTDTTSNQR